MENIIDEANRCLSCKVRPCSKACPLGNDIPSFIKQEAEKPPVKWMNNSRPVKRRYERYENEIKK